LNQVDTVRLNTDASKPAFEYKHYPSSPINIFNFVYPPERKFKCLASFRIRIIRAYVRRTA